MIHLKLWNILCHLQFTWIKFRYILFQVTWEYQTLFQRDGKKTLRVMLIFFIFFLPKYSLNVVSQKLILFIIHLFIYFQNIKLTFSVNCCYWKKFNKEQNILREVTTDEVFLLQVFSESISKHEGKPNAFLVALFFNISTHLGFFFELV